MLGRIHDTDEVAMAKPIPTGEKLGFECLGAEVVREKETKYDVPDYVS